MEDVPKEPQGRHRVDGLCHRSDDRVQDALLSGYPEPRVTEHRPFHGHEIPTAEWIARQITEAFAWNQAPDYLLRDRNPVFNGLVQRRLRTIGIRDRPITPRSPCQNGYVGRLIESIWRECPDHVLIFGESHLRRVMKAYVDDYNNARTHLSLGKDAPRGCETWSRGTITSISHLGGLHYEYVRI